MYVPPQRGAREQITDDVVVRRQRSQERLKWNHGTSHTLTIVLPLNLPPGGAQNRRIFKDTIIQGWGMKRAIKIKCFWSDHMRLQGHFSWPMLWNGLSWDPNRLFSPAIYTLHAEFSVLWSERRSCWRGEFGYSDHCLSHGTCTEMNALCTMSIKARVKSNSDVNSHFFFCSNEKWPLNVCLRYLFST